MAMNFTMTMIMTMHMSMTMTMTMTKTMTEFELKYMGGISQYVKRLKMWDIYPLFFGFS